jgi:hypothetical protein
MENKEVKHKHSIELGDNITYLLWVVVIAGLIFGMSYFHLWEQLK